MGSEDNSIDEEKISDVSTQGGYGKSVSYRELKSYASTNNVNSDKGQLKRKLNQKLKRSLLKGEIQETTPGNYEIVGKGYRATSRRRRSRSRSRRRKTKQMQVCLSVAPSRTRRRKRSIGSRRTPRRRSRTKRVSSRGRRGRRINVTKRRRSRSRSQRRRLRRTSRSRRPGRPRRTSRKRVSRVHKQAEKIVPTA